jgi:hypothetical protein
LERPAGWVANLTASGFADSGIPIHVVDGKRAESGVLVTIESDFEAIENGTRKAEKRLSVPIEDFSRLVG